MHKVAGWLIAVSLAAPMVAQAQVQGEAIPLITVQGSAELHAEPDLAIVRLGVEAQEETADVAQQRVNTAAQTVYEAIEAAGIAAESIQTTGISLSPVYAQSGQRGGDRRLVGYRAQNVVQVRISDMEQVGPVLDAGLAAGANRVDGIQFSLEDDATLRRDALTRAVAEAREKAEAIAAAMGVALGAVHGVQEGGVSVQPFHARGAMMEMAAADMGSTPIAAGQVSVSAQITVQYRIGDGS